MTQFPGTFVGFFTATADILKELGDEWKEHKKFQWASVFYESSDQLRLVASNLLKIKEEFDTEQITPKDLVQNFVDDIKTITKKIVLK